MDRQYRLKILIRSAFLIIGVLIVLIGIRTVIKSYDHSDEILTNGFVSKVRHYTTTNHATLKTQKHTDVYVCYSVNGRWFETELQRYIGTFEDAEPLEVYYNKADIRDIRIKGQEIYSILFLLLGVMVAVATFLPLHALLKKIRILEGLKETEAPVYAEYDSTTINTKLRFLGRYPYVIVCRWKDPVTGEGRKFESWDLWDDPTDLIKERGITQFPVYLHPKLQNYYLVDLGALATERRE